MDKTNGAGAAASKGATGVAELVGPHGERRQLTEEQYRACCDFLWPDEAVAIEYDSGRLTTGQAAEILGISRRTLTRMLDRGEIPCTRMGKNHHRIVMLPDVLEFKAKTAGYMSEVYAALARSERDVEAGRVIPAEVVHAEMRAKYCGGQALAQAG